MFTINKQNNNNQTASHKQTVMTNTPFHQASLPVPNPTTSYWQAEAVDSNLHNHGQDDTLPLHMETEPIDVAIIGSGISGAVVAYMLQNGGNVRKEEDVQDKSIEKVPSIIMLEARQACSGATGRNGGHCRPDTFAGFAKYSKIAGEQQADRVLKNEWETFQLMEQIIQREQLDCDWWKGRTMGVLRNEKLKEDVEQIMSEYKNYLNKSGQDLHPDLHFISDEQKARQLSRVKDAKAITVWPAASLHPLRFVHGLLSCCLKHDNFQLYTHTPAQEIIKEQKPNGIWSISTPKGIVRARSVVLATNAYSTKLLPALQNVLIPHRAQCSAIAPPKNFINKMALNTTLSIIKSPGDYEYLTQQPSLGSPNYAKQFNGRVGSGSFILGGGHPYASREEQIGTFDDSIVIDSIEEHLRTFPQNTFVDWKATEDNQLTHIWTGIQGYTRDSLPLVGSHYESNSVGLYLNLGHHGHGMARAATCSRGVARLLLHRLTSAEPIDDDQWEKITLLPKSYRWTELRALRTDVDCREDF